MTKRGRQWEGRTIRETFDSRYRIEDNGCWIWKDSKNPVIHPKMRIELHGPKRPCSHFAWSLKHGKDVPVGMQVLHACDRPTCVNPDHLFIGTQRDNIADMVKKRRQAGATGTRNSHAKLDEEKVREIRRHLTEGVSINSLAEKFGVTRANIRCIAKKSTWRGI